MKRVYQKQFEPSKIHLDSFIDTFDNTGLQFGKADRNIIKLFTLDDLTVNIKAFRIPNLINRIAYRFFRKSKAQRSFEHATRLTKFSIGTPSPIAYFENFSVLGLKDSYYVSEHLHYDLTYRELTTDFNIPNHESILRAFTRFTYALHEKGIYFLDHSPGNTLIRLNNGNYKFYLVDLNRMKFRPLDFNTRIKNFSRLTIHKFMVEIMSDEYAKCYGKDYNKVFALMWHSTQTFQNKFHRKRRLKNKLFFWRALN